MEPLYSVILYSKYSPNCKKILDMIRNGGVDFENIVRLQSLCVDNPQIRKRVEQDDKISVTILPCILSIYNNGGVEKYDGNYAFKWVETVIESYAPRPEPQFQPQPESEPEHETEPTPELRKHQRKPINGSGISSIDDIPLDDSDRHKNKPPIRRLQRGNDVIEDETLFEGEPPSMRRPSGNVIRDTSKKTQEDPHGTLARAKELAQGRESIEKDVANPADRPQAPR